MPQHATQAIMNIALRKPRMTRDEFFAWAQTQDQGYEFDGFEPVAMTGGNINHDEITFNIRTALRARLKNSPCRPFGPNAGLATIGDAVRYPDALVTCTKVSGDAYVVPGVVIVFEVVSRTSGRIDRVVKLREYRAVPSIRRYVILEHNDVVVTVLSRQHADENWTSTGLASGDILTLPEVGIEIAVTELYENVDLAPPDQQETA
jgi:Uma2 family endonuclease